jgi:hypothetical protein
VKVVCRVVDHDDDFKAGFQYGLVPTFLFDEINLLHLYRVLCVFWVICQDLF